MIEIIAYEDRYAGDFKKINLEWLDKYGLTESHDLAILDDPRGTIIDRGGAVFLAKDGTSVIGSAGIIPESDGVFELAKMAVTDGWKGRGIGSMLIQKCIEAARTKNAAKLTLFSNHQLTTAIRLYEKFGFRHVAVEHSPFLTADVKMELVF